LEKNGEGGIYNMRKYVIGFLVGVLCASVAPAYGAVSSLVGKKVSGEYVVKVDGNIIEGKSIAIDGTTYAPLRIIGDATGYNVTFENKEVIFTKKQEVNTVPNEAVTVDNSIAEIDAKIAGLQNNIRIWSKIVEGFDRAGSTDAEAENARNQLKQLQDELKLWEQRKAELEGQGQ
jgi:hypothetical protein